MTRLEYLDETKRYPSTVLTVGTFDGVHEGHKQLIRTVVEKANMRGDQSVIVTFDPHPREIINPGSQGIKLLTTLEERRRIMSELGVDLMLVIPFDRDFSLLSSEEFIRDIIYGRIGVNEFVIGYDHQFGRNREGGIETVRQLGRDLGFDVHVVEPQEVAEVTVSSTTVRKALEQEGNVELAREFLGWPYRLSGRVVHGDSRGHELGFPTANLQPDHSRKVIPKNGVYAVDVQLPDLNKEKKWRGMMNIGVRPTFDSDSARIIEVHIIDFDEDIYGAQVELEFLRKIRDERKFDGKQQLIQQLEKDKADCLQVE